MRWLNFLCFDSLAFFDLLRLNMTQTFAAELKIFNWRVVTLDLLGENCSQGSKLHFTLASVFICWLSFHTLLIFLNFSLLFSLNAVVLCLSCSQLDYSYICSVCVSSNRGRLRPTLFQRSILCSFSSFFFRFFTMTFKAKGFIVHYVQ